MSLCSKLGKLRIWLDTDFTDDELSLDIHKAMLDSWDAEVPLQEICLYPCHQYQFTRQGFAELLAKMGRILEEWSVHSLVSTRLGEEFSKRHTERKVCVDLYDWEVWKDWWMQVITN